MEPTYTDSSKETVQCVSRVDTIEKSSPKSLWQSVKASPRIVGYCLALSSAILMYGYDLVIVAAVAAMPQFQYVSYTETIGLYVLTTARMKFGQEFNGIYIIPSMWLSLWNVSSCIGLMFGSIIGGYYQERRGRRITLAIGSFLSTIAVAICYISDLPDEIDSRRGVFFAGKLFQGACIGIMLGVSQTYMSEVLPVVLRGPIIAFYPIFTLLGQLIGSAVVYTSLKYTGAHSYRVCFASQWPFSAVPLILAALLPESPTWLLRKKRPQEALKAQKRLDTARVDSDAVIAAVQTSILAEEEETGNSSYIECFRGVNTRRTMIVAFAQLIPQLFGLQLLANSSYFMQIVGMNSSNSLMILMLGIALGLLGNIGSLWTLSAFGRRVLTLSSLAIVAVLWLGMGIAGIFQGTVTIWYSAITLMLVVTISGLGSWPASQVVSTEASSLKLRSQTLAIGWFTAGVGTGVFAIILPYIYNPDEGNFRAKTGFVMMGIATVGFVLTWLIVPEMKDRTPMEIDRMFALRLPARRFKNWQSDVVTSTETTDSDRAG
ncbi:hypothetical protein N7452_010529 [Penicillium brevicompactum]|uniref:Major facilitator superfamily (MFS) profile domain-containing protein n=1 Tax=Penicillium brevicompactum TaxID=5074 RepID=A0A9W9UC93_PENBR|nr:hypothetical protein N7452_010529 [Penicillium brevicompactum]